MGWRKFLDIWPSSTVPTRRNAGPKVPEDVPATAHRQIDDVFEGTRIWLHYADGAGCLSERWVRFANVQTSSEADYLNGFCELRDDWRTFRIDRIVDLADAHGELLDVREFLAVCAISPRTSQRYGPKPRTTSPAALELVKRFGDVARILSFIAHRDAKFARTEGNVVRLFVEHECQVRGFNVATKDVNTFLHWCRIIRPEQQSLETILSRIKQAADYNADDIWQLAALVAEADGRTSLREKQGLEVLRSILNESLV